MLAGHMEGTQRITAMRPLVDAQPGEVVEVTDSAGGVHSFSVVERRVFPKHQLDPALFSTEGPHRLVLITCGGEYDRQRGYADNIAVVARPAGS